MRGRLVAVGRRHSDGCVVLLQADLLQVPVWRPHFQETTALGAAIAAGLGIGFWSEELVGQSLSSMDL